MFIGTRYQTAEKQKNQAKNEIRNQVNREIFYGSAIMIHELLMSSEIQHHHFPTTGVVRAVPFLS